MTIIYLTYINYTRHTAKTNKTHSTLCVGHHLTHDTRRRQTKQNTTQYLGHHYGQINASNVNKTRPNLQITGG